MSAEYNVDLARELLGKIPDQMVIAGLKEKLVLIIQSYHFEVNKHHSCKKVGTSPNGSATAAGFCPDRSALDGSWRVYR